MLDRKPSDGIVIHTFREDEDGLFAFISDMIAEPELTNQNNATKSGRSAEMWTLFAYFPVSQAVIKMLPVLLTVQSKRSSINLCDFLSYPIQLHNQTGFI